jgi:hypothetical protein
MDSLSSRDAAGPAGGELQPLQVGPVVATLAPAPSASIVEAKQGFEPSKPPTLRLAAKLLAVPLNDGAGVSTMPRGPFALIETAKDQLNDWSQNMNTAGGAFAIIQQSGAKAAGLTKGRVWMFSCECIAA